jgi:two-component system, sensor histidine kinase and response regulator
MASEADLPVAGAEAALRASDQRIRLLVDAAHEAFVAMNADGEITEWNRQAEKTFGWPRAEAVGRVLAETIIPPQYREAHARGLKHFLQTGEGPVLHQLIEITALRRNGDLFPVELTIVPIRLDEDYVFGAFVRDITKRKRIEEELRKAKEAAEDASRAKSEFVANMSHEIRTPMNGILGMTELALDTELTREQRDYLNMVKVSAESLLGVIDDILDFSKIEAHKLRLDAVDFSLRESLGDTMKALALRAQQKGLELACHVPADVPDGLNGDAGRLRQVIVNLVGNAIKFTSEGEVIVDVKLESQSADAVLLHFAIRDTGIGIPADKQQLIFEAFAQGDASTTREYGGTGLGLTISARLVEMMGGRIRLASELGKGSNFHFTARFGLAHGPVAGSGISRPESLQGLRVLVVDDNATNRQILQEMLTNWRMRPAVVDGAASALAVLERAAALGEPFPLVLLDAMMPVVDGFMLAEQIKAHPELTGAILLMLSSAARPEDAARCRRLGIATYLTKPIKQSELLDAVLTAQHLAAKEMEPSGLVPPATHGRRLRVLLAEDNVINQRLATRLLEKHGHEAVVANNGLEALAALDRESFDLVLMDVQMPEMGGFEAAAAIRLREASRGGYSPDRRHIPIIAMTAHAMQGDRERCLRAGMDYYVSKPVRAEELFGVIDRILPPDGEVRVRTAPLAEPLEDQEIDKAELMRRVGGDLGLLKEITGVFLDTCPGLLAELKEAVDRRDSAALHRTAHTFKGVLSNFGAKRAETAASRLETMGRGQDLGQVEKAHADFVEAIDHLKPALTRLLGKGSG